MARLDDVTPHILRHTFAYSYLENNDNDLVALVIEVSSTPILKLTHQSQCYSLPRMRIC